MRRLRMRMGECYPVYRHLQDDGLHIRLNLWRCTVEGAGACFLVGVVIQDALLHGVPLIVLSQLWGSRRRCQSPTVYRSTVREFGIFMHCISG